MSQIVAREKQIRILEKLLGSGRPEFLAIFGRRRVGKTYLIREFFRNKGIYFHLTGVKEAPLSKQLKNFAAEFKRVFGYPPQLPKDWQEAFALLTEATEKIKGSGRIILFFDELPWLATRRSGFLQDLDYAWNRHFSGNNRILLIVCGSAAAWMIRHVVREKGGLHGRLTESIRLLPFDLSETEQFLKSRNIVLDRRQIIDIYMAIGGVPKYLSYVERGLSSSQIINKICFSGPLLEEFDELYSSLFEDHDNHINIIRALASRNQGLTKVEIARAAGKKPGGGLNKILDELEQSGFVLIIPNLGKKKKEVRYQLSDEYSLFYIRWIEPTTKLNVGGLDTNFWLNMEGSSQARTWSGFAFESLCMKHIANIKQALGISGVQTQTAGWFYKAKKKSPDRGAQIDMLIDRADNCINLCEIKLHHNSKPFVISKSYEQELREKKAVFLNKTETKKTIFFTFITLYGVNKESGYFGIVDKELTMDDLF